MIDGFQDGGPTPHRPRALDLTREQYVDVWRRLGFEAETPARFHPFWCEIASLETADVDEPQIVEMLWPAIRLGNMLFSRAGVRVRAPASLLAPDVAPVSTLYWCWHRRERPVTDLSEGWGHNSQWGTDFRRDFDLGDRYAYNVDVAASNRLDLRTARLNATLAERMDHLSVADRAEFLRHRYLTRPVLEHDLDLWPYDDFFEESKG